ncbi:hypothetical protein [Rhodococcus wratislaviensis]|uniref:hypothetical protein n=1 Tax=Rhodococcus wratislaviensis TaxID=44752 RepID=UPI000F587865|nr:hypothetical protein [Rhodococcus wratislaviensis]
MTDTNADRWAPILTEIIPTEEVKLTLTGGTQLSGRIVKEPVGGILTLVNSNTRDHKIAVEFIAAISRSGSH